MPVRPLVYSIFLLFHAQIVLAQCSDAGACAIPTKRHSPQHHMGTSYLYGTSGQPDNLTFHTITFNVDLALSDHTRLSVGVPYSSQSGPRGQVRALGDPIIVWTQTLVQTPNSSFFSHLGIKFPLADPNKGTLPQAYQSTLGTTDVLVGITYALGRWNASAVYQISRGRSDNRVDRLQRGDDILVRAAYLLPFETIRVTAVALFITRLQESSVLNNSSIPSGQFVNIPMSDQSQINVQAQALLPLTDDFALEGQAAMPLLQRSVNVDRLKRSLSLSLGMLYTL